MLPESHAYAHESAHSWLFPVLWLGVLFVSFGTVRALVTLSSENDRYTHILVIAPISVFLIYLDRKRVFRQSRISPGLGIPALAAATIIYMLAAAWAWKSAQDDRLWLAGLAIVALWIAAFVLLYGLRSTRAAIFSLCFLLLMVPIPGHILDRVVYGLQAGSAQVTYMLFKVLRIPVLRDGFRFSLPGIDIEIATECSGIRSSLALLITGLLAAHLFLRSAWSKLAFALLIVPVAIFKNAVRIVILSSLGLYVNRDYLTGPLHHRGGPLFALVGFAILVPALIVLRKIEGRFSSLPVPAGDAVQA